MSVRYLVLLPALLAAGCKDSVIDTGATEVCDGEDNNGNGLVDEDDPELVIFAGFSYPDRDGDGYGVRDGTPQTECWPPGWVTNADDCDDADAAIYPFAPETCGDGVDSDCDEYEDPWGLCDSGPVDE